MGFLGNFNRTESRGDIFVSTAAREPYNAVATEEVVKTLNTLSHLVRTFDSRQYQRRNDIGDAVMYQLRSDIRNTSKIFTEFLDIFIDRLSKSYPDEFNFWNDTIHINIWQKNKKCILQLLWFYTLYK